MLADKYGLEREIMRSSGYAQPVDIQGPAFRQVERGIGRHLHQSAGVPQCNDWHHQRQRLSGYLWKWYPFCPGSGWAGADERDVRPNETVGEDCLPGAVDFYETCSALRRTVCSEQTRPFI